MFYSHHLLARKAPMGQIWMAATMHAKINRRKLDKLDIIKICEEILNPTVPMALRLSGILMGGVVIVYERKVKLLYEDVNRFLIEINEAWKVNPAVDPTVLPKGKAQAKFEAVTLPNVVETETEQTIHFSDASFNISRLQRMRLDDVDEQFININIRDDEDPSHQHHHQAEAANITLFDEFTSCLENTDLYNRFERFDIGEDEETQINFTPQEQQTMAPSPPLQDVQPQSQTTPIASPPAQNVPAQENQPMGERVNPQPEAHTERAEAVDGNEMKQQQPLLRKRKARRNLPRVVMDDDQIMIPGNIYQLWLQDASSIISKRGRRNKSLNPVFNTKIANLMEIPPVALLSGQMSIDEPCYSVRLLKLWRKCTMTSPANGVSTGEILPDSLEKPASHSHSPLQGLSHRTVPSFAPGDFQSEVGSHTIASSVEKLRPAQENMDPQTIFDEAVPGDRLDFPMSPAGQSSRSAPSSGSGNTLFPSPEELLPTSTRARKRQHSSARSNLGNLDPVEEEGPLEQHVRSFKIPRKLPKGTTFDSELLEETGPTQTPHPVISDPSADSITQSICTHLKMHFDTPGAPHSESVEQLAYGMNRKKAAMLFYQTCVLTTLDFVKVNQAEPYGDILISRGPKM